jgi:hypothetical protein
LGSVPETNGLVRKWFMKICALVLAHGSISLLHRLLLRLESYGIPAFVHMDAKIDEAEYRHLQDATPAKFLPNRRSLRWGGFSIVRASLELAEFALADPDITDVILISGDTYPIKSREELLSFCGRPGDKIQYEVFPPGSETYQRIARNYLAEYRLGALRPTEMLERYVTNDLLAELHDLDRAQEIKVNTEFPWAYAKGSQWWCLTRHTVELAIHLARTHHSLLDWFQFSAIPDESFFHTIVANFVAEPPASWGPVYTVWDRNPRPYVFSSVDDLALLGETSLPFARKFAERDLGILDAIDALIAGT